MHVDLSVSKRDSENEDWNEELRKIYEEFMDCVTFQNEIQKMKIEIVGKRLI